MPWPGCALADLEGPESRPALIRQFIYTVDAPGTFRLLAGISILPETVHVPFSALKAPDHGVNIHKIFTPVVVVFRSVDISFFFWRCVSRTNVGFEFLIHDSIPG